MGAYLSQPKTDKVSTDETNEVLAVGASSMQGWRNSQEDAHNAILNYGENASFFAVYDGHGGAEVATYCADKLPQHLKELNNYEKGNFEDALEEAFMTFDHSLLNSTVVGVLKVLAGEKNVGDPDDSDDADEDEEDLAELHEESNLPLNEVLQKYKVGGLSVAGCGLSMPALKKVKEVAGEGGVKPQSPYLRGRRAAAVAADAANKAVMDPDAKPQGSSTSAAAAAAAAIAVSSRNDVRPSSSKGIGKSGTHEPEEDSTVSSSSSRASKTNSNKNNVVTAEDTEAEAAVPNAAKKITTNGASSTNIQNNATTTVASGTTNLTRNAPDSSHIKESDQNGSVTSSEAKTIATADVSTSSKRSLDADAIVSGSCDAAASGKQNGSIDSSSNSKENLQSDYITRFGMLPVSPPHRPSTPTKTLRLKKVGSTFEFESTDDDSDFDDRESSSSDYVEQPADELMSYSSSEELDDDDDDENEGDDEEDEDDDDANNDDEGDDEDEEEDEEGALANEQFCANMVEEPGKDSGCTAVVAIIQGRDLYVANAGDSRCVVCRNGTAIEMSIDHKPEDEEESARIIKAGGRVTLDGRVNGGLNLSRAIGDHAYKMNCELLEREQMISALPDIRKLIITPEDEFMVLACDGIWNYMSSEEVVDFVRLRLKDESKSLSAICEELFDHCLAPNTIGDGTGCDNMTAVIVRFLPKLQELPTKLNPNETEDVLAAKRAADADAADASLQKSLKRCASPSADGNANEAENATKNKRLKTDTRDTNIAVNAAVNSNNNSERGNDDNNSNAVTASATDGNVTRVSCVTTTTSVRSSTSSGISNSISASVEQKECDSVSASTATSNANNEAATVSST